MSILTIPAVVLALAATCLATPTGFIAPVHIIAARTPVVHSFAWSSPSIVPVAPMSFRSAPFIGSPVVRTHHGKPHVTHGKPSIGRTVSKTHSRVVGTKSPARLVAAPITKVHHAPVKSVAQPQRVEKTSPPRLEKTSPPKVEQLQQKLEGTKNIAPSAPVVQHQERKTIQAPVVQLQERKTIEAPVVQQQERKTFEAPVKRLIQTTTTTLAPIIQEPVVQEHTQEREEVQLTEQKAEQVPLTEQKAEQIPQEQVEVHEQIPQIQEHSNLPQTPIVESQEAEHLGLPSGSTNLMNGAIDATFSCAGRGRGYYADTANQCRIYHQCNPGVDMFGREVMLQSSHVCPEGLAFDQQFHTCVLVKDLTVACNPADVARWWDTTVQRFAADELNGEANLRTNQQQTASIAAAQAADAESLQIQAAHELGF